MLLHAQTKCIKFDHFVNPISLMKSQESLREDNSHSDEN